jgi:hypothetical protein
VDVRNPRCGLFLGNIHAPICVLRSADRRDAGRDARKEASSRDESGVVMVRVDGCRKTGAGRVAVC